MMYLITGQPGNGKTLRALHVMREEYERNKQAHQEGKEELRRFFTNIAGATTEENPAAFPWVEKLPDHNDWTKLPDASYVVYDEAHSDGNTPGLERYGALFPSTGKPGESSDMRIRAMSTHRHRGFDLVFITQYPSKIHHQLRTLVGSHTHMNRGMGLQAAGVVQWPRVQVDPYDEQARDKAEEEIWSYPKDLYGKYKSATLHTASHKFKIPKKVVAGISKLVVTLLVLWALWHFLVPKGGPEEKPEEGGPQREASLLAPAAPSPDSSTSLTPGTQQFASINTEPTPAIAGCVSSDRGCRCFNTDGYQIDMSRYSCQALMEKPLPFNVYHEYKTGQGGTVTNAQTVHPTQAQVSYSPGQRSDQFPRSPGYSSESYTGPTTTL